MKNVFKKIITGALAVAISATSIFAMTSCNKEGFQKNTFKIGGTGPLTGENASYGTSVKNGAALAVKHINEKGGIQFSFSMKDDQAGEEAASTNFDILADEGMQVSISGVTSGSAKAFAEKANSEGVFSMSPSASADNVIDNMKYSYRLCFGDPDQGTIAANKIKAMQTENKWMTVGAIYDESTAYSKGIYDAFEAAMKAYKINYEVRTFNEQNKTDFSTQAEALKNCDVIFMPFYYNEAQLFVNAAVNKGFDGTFFGSDGFDGIASYVENVENEIMYITPFDVNAADTADFVSAYEEAYGMKPDQFAADAYDVVMVIYEAIKAAGIEDYDADAKTIGDAIIAVITSDSFSYDGLTGNNMTWDESGACTKEGKIVTID